jgi:hypothetical protein
MMKNWREWWINHHHSLQFFIMFTVYPQRARVNSKNNHKLHGQECDRSTKLIFGETAMLYTTLIPFTAELSGNNKSLLNLRFVEVLQCRNVKF